jgi:hypothetical protein
MPTFLIQLIDGDDNAIPEMPTGYVKGEIENIAKKADGDIISMEGYIICEWGNGEGENTYKFAMK